METKKRIDWLSESLDPHELSVAKRILTYQFGEEVVTKDMALYAVLNLLKTAIDSIDWDRINSEKFNNKVQLKMEDWGVAFNNKQCKISFRNSMRFYTEISNNKKLKSIYTDTDISGDFDVYSFEKTDFDILLSLFRPELERVTNEFNNR